MFVEVLSLIYHRPITIQSLTYRVLLGTLAYSASPHALLTKNRTAPTPHQTQTLSPSMKRMLVGCDWAVGGCGGYALTVCTGATPPNPAIAANVALPGFSANSSPRGEAVVPVPNG